MSEFIWTDELVAEFTTWSLNKSPVVQGRYSDIEQFKQSKLKTISKDWKIYEFDDNGVIAKREPYQQDFHFKGGNFSESYGLGKCKIHSVRRISDNTLWSVGDDTNSGKIVRFEKVDNEMLAYFIHGSFRNIGFLRKPKKPLFITEDGKAIYEGDRCWFVGKDFEINFYDFSVYENRDDLSHYPQLHKYFSTEAAAKEYIAKHKPKPYIVFTQPEYGSEMYVPYNYGNVVPGGIFERFETKEQAHEFCVRHKACLSINQVMNNSVEVEILCPVGFAKLIERLIEIVEKKLSK